MPFSALCRMNDIASSARCVAGEMCRVDSRSTMDFASERKVRADQMRTLIADMEKERYVIICGDFNISRHPEDTANHAVEYDVFAKAGYTLANRPICGL